MLVTAKPNKLVFPNWIAANQPVTLEWDGDKKLFFDNLVGTPGFSIEKINKGGASSPTEVTVTRSRLNDKAGKEFLGNAEVTIKGHFELNNSVTGTFSVSIDISMVEEIEAESEAVQCLVCFGRFSNVIYSLQPRVLTSCGHTVCTSCSISLVKPQKKPADISSKAWKPTIACPKCRKETQSQAVDLSLNLNILEYIKEMSPAKIDLDPFVPCFENDKHESEVFCIDCEKPFCKACFNRAHTSKVSATHKPVPISAIPMPKTFCSVHSDKPATTICLNKKCEISKFSCTDCDRVHRDHKKINVSEHACKKMEELKTMLHEVTQIEECLMIKIKKIEDCIVTYEKYHPTMIACTNTINDHFGVKKEEALEKFKVYVEREKTFLTGRGSLWKGNLLQVKRVSKTMWKRFYRKTDIHLVDIRNDEYQRALSLGKKPAGKHCICRKCLLRCRPLTIEHFNQTILNTLITSNTSEPQGQEPEVPKNVQAVTDEPAAKKQKTDGNDQP